MTRLHLSRAAAGLFRALIARTGLPRNRILLSACASTDWQSLTFTGERHELRLRLTGEDARPALARLRDGIADAEFDISGHFVADIGIHGAPVLNADGSVDVAIEALTIED